MAGDDVQEDGRSAAMRKEDRQRMKDTRCPLCGGSTKYSKYKACRACVRKARHKDFKI
jgi:hypothetical protein